MDAHFTVPDPQRSDLSEALNAFALAIVNRKIIFSVDIGERRRALEINVKAPLPVGCQGRDSR
jgi:hypothetical protein